MSTQPKMLSKNCSTAKKKKKKMQTENKASPHIAKAAVQRWNTELQHRQCSATFLQMMAATTSNKILLGQVKKKKTKTSGRSSYLLFYCLCRLHRENTAACYINSHQKYHPRKEEPLRLPTEWARHQAATKDTTALHSSPPLLYWLNGVKYLISWVRVLARYKIKMNKSEV